MWLDENSMFHYSNIIYIETISVLSTNNLQFSVRGKNWKVGRWVGASDEA